MRKSILKFDITDFSDYKTVSGQYTDSFIKSSRCVKVSETDSEVLIAVSEGSKGVESLIKRIHHPNTVESITVKDSDFAEFIGNCVDTAAPRPLEAESGKEAFSLEEINSDAPVVNIINAVCLEGIRKSASDIHIQGCKESIRIRFRLDGVLQTVKELDKGIYAALVSRIKVMAGLNVMENRSCQDGIQSPGRKKYIEDYGRPHPADPDQSM